MHQNKSVLRQIGEESSGRSSDFTSTQHPLFFLPTRQNHLQIQTQNRSTLHKPLSHLRIQIPSLSPQPSPQSTPNHQNFRETHFQNEPFWDKSSANKTLISTPHKRPVMAQTPSNLSHSPTLTSLHHFHDIGVSDAEPSGPSSVCSSSFAAVAFTAKTIAVKFSRHLCHVRWLQVHLRFIILLFMASLYLFTSTQGTTFALHFLSILAFSATLVISFGLALPRLPSIRSLIARSSPIKLCLSSRNSSSNPRPPVVWSIGSKPKLEKRPKSGSWVQVHSNGDVYEGEFHRGKCSGSGVYYYYMSGRYEGDWVNEKYDGYGVETWAKGSRYRGQYRQGLRHGFGVYRFFTGDVYAGEWCNGQCHGCGVYTCDDGSRYVGEFKWGVKHGLGHYHFRNGDKYAGEYFADKMHGFGVYHFGNGHRYEGAWHEGRRQGLGMYTFRNGDTQSGHWQNGFLDVSSIQGTLLESSITATHSKVLNAVQEAQRAAQKAVNVAKAEERVNKAVAAANKAANAARVAAVKAVQNQMHCRSNNDDVPTRIA